MQLTITFLNIDGTQRTAVTDDSHISFYSPGLTFNDGVSADYTFLPWPRILRIISTAGVPLYPQ